MRLDVRLTVRLVRPLAVALMMTLPAGACISGERLSGPTLRIANDSGDERSVRVSKEQWSLPPDGDGLVALPIRYLDQEVALEILDGSCELIQTVPLRFGHLADADLAIDLLPAGETVRTATLQDIQAIWEVVPLDAQPCP